MKRHVTLVIVLLLGLSALGLAQHSAVQRNLPTGLGQINLAPTKPQFNQAEDVEFVLKTLQAPATLQGSYYTIEKMVGPNNWMEFYRSSQNPFEQEMMAANSEQTFGWGQMNTAGTQSADPGTYRVRLFLARVGTVGQITAPFTIVQGGGTVSGGQNATLEMKLMRYKLRAGDKPTFRVQNVGGSPANMDGHRYVIQFQKGNQWIDFWTSSVNPLGIQSLASGQIYKFIWPGHDRTGRTARPGVWRIVFYAPHVAGSPFTVQFTLR